MCQPRQANIFFEVVAEKLIISLFVIWEEFLNLLIACDRRAPQSRWLLPGPYLGFFVCGGKLGFREISDQYSYKKQPSKIRHYVRKKTFSFPGGGNCPLRPPAMYGPDYACSARVWPASFNSFVLKASTKNEWNSSKAICDHARSDLGTCNFITRVLIIYHVKVMQSTAFEQKRFDLRSLSPILCNLWLLLV